MVQPEYQPPKPSAASEARQVVDLTLVSDVIQQQTLLLSAIKDIAGQKTKVKLLSGALNVANKLNIPSFSSFIKDQHDAALNKEVEKLETKDPIFTKEVAQLDTSLTTARAHMKQKVSELSRQLNPNLAQRVKAGEPAQEKAAPVLTRQNSVDDLLKELENDSAQLANNPDLVKRQLRREPKPIASDAKRDEVQAKKEETDAKARFGRSFAGQDKIGDRKDAIRSEGDKAFQNQANMSLATRLKNARDKILLKLPLFGM